MSVGLICIIAGPVISVLVSLLKKVSFVSNYPKSVAFVLSILTGAATMFLDAGTEWWTLAQCTLIPFAASIATYEVVTKPITDASGEI